MNRNLVVYFSLEYWKSILAKRGTSPEEKGYWFCEKQGDQALSLFQVTETTGSAVQVSSLDSFLNAIEKLTAKYSEIYVIPYHTHPVEGPSGGDRNAYFSIYNGTRGVIQDFLTIGPRSVELNRVVQNGGGLNLINIVHTDYLKVLIPDSQTKKRISQKGNQCSEDFLQFLEE